jgi:ornithine cyclodeaminase
MIVLSRSEIEELIDYGKATAAIEAAYKATSRGEVNLPPVGHITFPDFDADCHIKYGHIKSDPTFVIKIATGFPKNAAKGISSGNGSVLVMSSETGEILALLHDEMILTDIRTGIGGAIASRALARQDSKSVLVVGTGPQARRQIEAHRALLGEGIAIEIWGRSQDRSAALAKEMSASPSIDLEASVRRADIIVTATGSTTPLILSDWVGSGTHITAVGADAPGKQELDTALVARAEKLICDLAGQCLDHGEVSHAFKTGLIETDDLIELGAVLEDPTLGRKVLSDITIADLTGIAAQDIAMANTVLSAKA